MLCFRFWGSPCTSSWRSCIVAGRAAQLWTAANRAILCTPLLGTMATRRLAWGTRAGIALLVAADLAAGLTAISNSNIHSAVSSWLSSRSSAESTYGHISGWDTSQVTNMQYLFCGRSYSYCGSSYTYYKYDARYFNDDISAWDVSRVTTMYKMFYYAQNFNQNLGWCVDYDVSISYITTYSGCSYSNCGVTQQSYCPTPSPTPVATGFAYISSTRSYSSALSYCRTYHIDLASIHSSIENAAVAALCPATAYYGCWIGGSDSASEGTWTWSDSTEWNYENWRSGEPTTSSSSSYDYLIIYSNGGWADSTTTTANYKPFVCSTTTPPGSSSGPDKDKDQEDNTIALVSIFAALALAAAWGFHAYRERKIKRSRGLRREIKRMNSELNTYKNAAVGMRVAVTAAGPTAPAAGPVTWFWEESPVTPGVLRLDGARRRAKRSRTHRRG